jgi:hypothetical protein
MSGITTEQQFIRALRSHTSQKATFTQLADLLPLRRGVRWTIEEVESKARELSSDVSSPIFVVRHGVQYFGSENRKECALYKETAASIVRLHGKANGESKAKPYFTSRPPSGSPSGIWQNPDLVVAVRRREGSDPREHFHAIEIEQANGFDIRSVYQAHEQGRGADFAWVYYAAGTRSSADSRSVRAAKELGVGIVRMPQMTVPSKWDVEVKAKQQTVTSEGRRAVLALIDR